MDEMILAYMNNEKTAVQDIDTFLNITLDEFEEFDTEYCFGWMESLPKGRYRLDKPLEHPRIKEMNFIDLFALLHEYTKVMPDDNVYYQMSKAFSCDSDESKEQERCRKATEAHFAKEMTQFLLKAQHHDGRIRLFLATPVKLFFEILGKRGAVIDVDEETGEESGYMIDWLGILLDDVYQAAFDQAYSKLTDSVGEMLQKAVTLTTGAWKPSRRSLESYGDKIEAAYRIFYDILLFPFQEAYPERYGAEAVGKRHMLNDMLY